MHHRLPLLDSECSDQHQTRYHLWSPTICYLSQPQKTPRVFNATCIHATVPSRADLHSSHTKRRVDKKQPYSYVGSERLTVHPPAIPSPRRTTRVAYGTTSHGPSPPQSNSRLVLLLGHSAACGNTSPEIHSAGTEYNRNLVAILMLDQAAQEIHASPCHTQVPQTTEISQPNQARPQHISINYPQKVKHMSSIFPLSW